MAERGEFLPTIFLLKNLLLAMMFPLRRRLNLFRPIWVATLLGCVLCGNLRAQHVVLYLKNGDKLTGVLVSEYTNRIVLSNNWVKDLSVPLSEIAQREVILANTNHIAGTNQVNFIAKFKAPPIPAPPPLFKHWKGEAEVGLDLIYGVSDQRTYHGRFKLAYELPYAWNPKNFFRNSLDYDLSYGKTTQKSDGIKTTTTSSDRMGFSDKTTGDFDGHWYGYNLIGAGFDRVRNIGLSIEEGPGLGYHLLRYTNLTANVEGGFSYQLQDNTDNTHTRDFFYRVAEDFNWKVGSRTSVAEKVEFFPRFNFTEYRLRAEVTLSYNIWRYVYWNMTVRDSYDTTPVANVQGNELEVHSALGVKF
jgi:hypothetical protein